MPKKRPVVPSVVTDPVPGLTPQQQAFADDWMRTNNATDSYLAHYPGQLENRSRGAAAVEAHYLLRSPAVAAYIRRMRDKISEQLIMDRTDVLRGFENIALADVTEIFDENGDLRSVKDWPAHVRQAVASIKVRRVFEGKGKDAVPVDLIEVKMASKSHALEQLAKHFGLYERDNTQRNPWAALSADVLAKLAQALGDDDGRSGDRAVGSEPDAGAAGRRTH